MPELPPAVELMTVKVPHGKPTLAEAAKQLGVTIEDMDAAFGLVPVDPDRGIYAVQVRADKLPKQPERPSDYRGPWSNPSIAPLGPVQGDNNKGDKK